MMRDVNPQDAVEGMLAAQLLPSRRHAGPIDSRCYHGGVPSNGAQPWNQNALEHRLLHTRSDGPGSFFRVDAVGSGSQATFAPTSNHPLLTTVNRLCNPSVPVRAASFKPYGGKGLRRFVLADTEA